VAADAIARGDLGQWLFELANAEVKDALIDLRPPSTWTMTPEDRDFLAYCGEDDDRSLETICLALPPLGAWAKKDFRGCTVLLPAGVPPANIDLLRNAGLRVAPTVSSLEEALAAKEPVLLSTAFTNLAGGHLAAQKLRHMILEHGGQLADEGSMSLGEAAGALLGGGH